MCLTLAGLLAVAGLFLGDPASARAQGNAPYGFVQTPQGVMWGKADGTWAKDEWIEILGLVYHVDQNGLIQTGLTRVGENVYYLLPEGRRYTGWLTLDDALYFFRDDGTMAVDTLVGAWQVGGDGKLILQEGQVLPTDASPLQLLVNDILAGIVTPMTIS